MPASIPASIPASSLQLKMPMDLGPVEGTLYDLLADYVIAALKSSPIKAVFALDTNIIIHMLEDKPLPAKLLQCVLICTHTALSEADNAFHKKITGGALGGDEVQAREDVKSLLTHYCSAHKATIVFSDAVENGCSGLQRTKALKKCLECFDDAERAKWRTRADRDVGHRLGT